MFEEFGRRLHIISKCPVKIFAVADMDAYWYPYKLQHVGNSRPGTREECLEYIVDSDIGDEDVTNEDVLDRAHELDATMVVPKDHVWDREATTESAHEFMDLYEEHPCHARPVMPLQPTTHMEGDEEVANTDHVDHVPDLPDVGAYMVGGVKDLDGHQHVEALRRVREVKPYAYLHGLGMGASPSFVAAVREEPRLVDSVDLQTPEKCAINGQTFGESLTQVDMLSPRGEWSSTHRATDSLSMLLKLNYLMGPLVDEEKADMLANRLLTSY